MSVLALDELLLLPYGDSIAPGVITTDALLALDYSGGPAFSKGLTAAAFRECMRTDGERVQWLRAVDSEATRTGKSFVVQSLDAEVRVFIHSNVRTVQDEEFGEIATGETRLSWMPDELSPQRDDRFIALDRTLTARETLEASTATTRALLHQNLVLIEAVYEGDELVAPTNYALVNGALMWINGYLPDGAVVVFAHYRPTYELLGGNWKQGSLGHDGAQLPSNAPLRLLTADEE